MWLIVIAALVRKGIVPFHAWVPEVFDHGRLGPAILFSAPQLGAYMTVVLIVPRASPDVLRLDRHPRARHRGVRRGAGARADERPPGVRLPLHEPVGAGDGGARLHECRARWRAGCWCGCRPGSHSPDSPAVFSCSKRAAGGWT